MNRWRTLYLVVLVTMVTQQRHALHLNTMDYAAGDAATMTAV